MGLSAALQSLGSRLGPTEAAIAVLKPNYSKWITGPHTGVSDPADLQCGQRISNLFLFF